MQITINATPLYLAGEFVGLSHIKAIDSDGQRVEVTRRDNKLCYVSELHGDDESMTGYTESTLDAWIAIGVHLGLLPLQAFTYEQHPHEALRA